MAIAPTGDIYKALTFDNKSSRNYGVYITGEAVYNAPERDVEMITIPGRNGTFALDNGRFQNIEVSYPASIAADTEADFISAISEFRNFLCSKKGYCRLSDEYNPNEYRMAVYKSGLEVEPAQLRAGEFKITFDCKPQRFLTSGETAVSVASGGTLSNPTLFESSPLLAVKGYGAIGFNGYEIELENELVGPLVLLSAGSDVSPGYSQQSSLTEGDSFDSTAYSLTENGDTITLPSFSIGLGVEVASNQTLDGFTVSNFTHNISNYVNTTLETVDARRKTRYFNYGEQTWAKSTTGSYATDSFLVTLTITTTNNGTSTTSTKTLNVDLKFGFSSFGNITVRATFTNVQGFVYRKLIFKWDDVTTDSTQSVLGNPTYIDCDLGEAYKLVNSEPVSLNAYIDLGSQLPVLASGSNTITYDNTFTEVKVTPRWWRV